MCENSKSSRLSLSFDDEKRELMAKNLELHIALEKICEAVVNHKLNCKEVTSNDISLWETVFNVVDFD